ncbi:unnamed protein product [Sympodiomycopsis kandeliae]
MDFFFCLPVLFGFDKSIKQLDNAPHVCPRCHNGAVVKVKSRRKFSICFVPLIPLKSKKQWMCTICQWTSPEDGQFQPQPAGGGYGQGGAPGYYGGGGGYPQQPMHHGGGYPPK